MRKDHKNLENLRMIEFLVVLSSNMPAFHICSIEADRIFFRGERRSENETFHSLSYPCCSNTPVHVCFALFALLSPVVEVCKGCRKVAPAHCSSPALSLSPTLAILWPQWLHSFLQYPNSFTPQGLVTSA